MCLIWKRTTEFMLLVYVRILLRFTADHSALLIWLNEVNCSSFLREVRDFLFNFLVHLRSSLY